VKNDEETTTGFGTSFNIIVPSGYGLHLFKRLVFSGCKPIGHKEYLSIKFESGEPVFPDDYLHT
jgi:glycine cleavage system aminomethyltransferase T